MSASIPTTAKILVDNFDLTPYFTSVKVNVEREALDSTTLASGANKEAVPGLDSGGVSCEGFYDKAPDGIEAVLGAALSGRLTRVATIIDANEVGSTAQLLRADTTKHEVSLQPAQIIQSNAELSAPDGIDSGVVLQALGIVAADGNAAALDNLVATTKGGVAHLHLTGIAGAGTSVVVKIEGSEDAVVWTPLVTFNALTAASLSKHQRIEVAGNVPRRLRAWWDVSGAAPAATFAVAFARR